MTNNEKFNALINSCDHLCLVLNALRTFAPLIMAAQDTEQEGGEEA